MSPLFEIKNISCERNDRWLFKNLSFSVAAGEILQILGTNGSGKTSLLKILTGLMPAAEGEVLWRQQNIARHRLAYCNELLYIGHLSAITASLTVTENLSYYTQALTHCAASTDIKAALSHVGLAEYATVSVSSLSAGQQRRINLARLLLSSAPLWILDEPLNTLDQQGIKLLETTLIKHIQRQGLVIITSHQPLSITDITIRHLPLS